MWHSFSDHYKDSYWVWTLTWEELQQVLSRARPGETFHLHYVHLLLLWLWIRLIGRQWWVFIFTRCSCLKDKTFKTTITSKLLTLPQSWLYITAYLIQHPALASSKSSITESTRICRLFNLILYIIQITLLLNFKTASWPHESWCCWSCSQPISPKKHSLHIAFIPLILHDHIKYTTGILILHPETQKQNSS